jgi:outer membrane protein TolC
VFRIFSKPLPTWLLPPVVAASTVLAQDPTAAKPAKPTNETAIVLPVDREAEQRGLPIRQLTLKDALRLGRSNNVELRAAELKPQQAKMDLLYAEAGFNPELYGDAGYGRSQSPARSAFQPELERATADATIGWRQRVVTGGLFDLAFNPARYTNNSAAAFGLDRL